MAKDPQTELEDLLREEPYVRALARVLCASNEDEIVQQTWLQACAQRPTRIKQPRAWLGRIVRNVAKNLLRREGRNRQREQHAAKRGVAPSSLELMQREERRSGLVKLVDALPHDQRAVMVLRYFEGLPPRDIATRLALPVGTVWNLHRRGLDRLRAALDAQTGNSRAAWLLPLLGTSLTPMPLDLAAPTATALPTGVLAGSIAMTMKTKLAAVITVAAAIALAVYWPETALPTPAPAAGASNQAPAAATGSTIDDSALANNQTNSEREAAPVTTNTVATTGSVRVTAFYGGEDRSPASNATIHCRRAGADWRVAPMCKTDESGVALFDDLPPGTVIIWGDRVDPGRKVEIVAGEIVEHELVFPDVPGIRGIVLNENNQPIKGAEITAAMPGLVGRDPAVLAITKRDGRFEIRCPPQPSFISARAEGYQPSKMQFAYARNSEAAEVKVQLLPGGGTVTGTVVDDQNQPIPQAVVCIGDPEIQGLGSIDDRPPAPALVRTGDDGTFRAISIPKGDTPIWVRARDKAPWVSKVVVAEYAATYVRITMQPGGIVRGVVTGRDGTPVPKAEVMHGDWRDIERVATYTDAQGHYELRGLPHGKVGIRAKHDKDGKADHVADLSPRQAVTLDLQLSRGTELAGKVTDQHGEPVVKLHVEATAERTAQHEQWMHYARTAADGSYSIPNCPDGRPIRVEFSSKKTQPKIVADFDPRRGPLNVQVERDVVEGYISGRILGENGQPLADVEVRPRCNQRDMFPRSVVTKADGKFEFGPLPNGKWDMNLVHKSHTGPSIPSFELAPTGRWEVGDVQMRLGGHAIIKSETVAGKDLSFMITDTQSRSRWTIRPADEPVTPLLRPGDYMLQVWGKRSAARAMRFTILGGQRTEVVLPTATGVQQHFDFVYDKDKHATYGATIKVFRGEQKIVDAWLSTQPKDDWSYDVWLLPGTYRVTMSGKLVAETTITIGTEQPKPLELTLLPR